MPVSRSTRSSRSRRYKSLTLETDALKPPDGEGRPGQNASGLQIFDLADSARNGAGNRLPPSSTKPSCGPTFWSPSETKADRMVGS
jgi:hypothetical protein